MEDSKEFMMKHHKCAEALSKWMGDNNFDCQVICRVFIDYFIAAAKQSNIPIKSTVFLIKSLYELPSMFFSDDLDDEEETEDESDECSDCDESYDSDALKVRMELTNAMLKLAKTC